MSHEMTPQEKVNAYIQSPGGVIHMLMVAEDEAAAVQQLMNVWPKILEEQLRVVDKAHPTQPCPIHGVVVVQGYGR